MSVSDLATGDTVVKQSETNSTGTSWGNSPSFTDGSSLDCMIQTAAASESGKYANRGMAFTHEAFFAADPGLTNQNRLKWTVKAGTTLSTPRYLRVLDVYTEGRPGEDELWVAELSEEQTRHDQ